MACWHVGPCGRGCEGYQEPQNAVFFCTNCVEKDSLIMELQRHIVKLNELNQYYISLIVKMQEKQENPLIRQDAVKPPTDARPY